MKNKIDKSLQEVWEMKEAAHKRFANSGFSNYAEYLQFRQKKIDEFIKQKFSEKLNYVTS